MTPDAEVAAVLGTVHRRIGRLLEACGLAVLSSSNLLPSLIDDTDAKASLTPLDLPQ